MRMAAHCLAFLGLVFLAMAALGANPEDGTPAVRWMLTGLPPKYIPDGPLRGAGYGEQQVALLVAQLPQFAHRPLEIVTPARLWHEMQTGRGVCSLDIARLAEREEWAVFSRHHTSIQGFGLLVRKDRAAEFDRFRDREGLVDLDRLAADEHLSGLQVTGRNYSGRIKDFIASPARKARLEPVTSSTRVFEMIANRRGDFTFATMIEMNYFNALQAAPGSRAMPALTMLAVKDSVEMVQGHIACSRDSLGRQVVEAADRLLDDEANWNRFFAPERRWSEEVALAPR